MGELFDRLSRKVDDLAKEAVTTWDIEYCITSLIQRRLVSDGDSFENYRKYIGVIEAVKAKLLKEAE